jgi:hypothetical protein
MTTVFITAASMVSMHKYMHQRTEQKNKIGQSTHYMGLMLGPNQIAKNTDHD